MEAEIPPRMKSRPSLPSGDTLRPKEVLQVVEYSAANVFSDKKYWVIGYVASTLRGPYNERIYFDIEADDSKISASIPVNEAYDLPVGTKVHVHGRLTLKARTCSVEVTVKGNILSRDQQKPKKRIACTRHLPLLQLSDFLLKYPQELLILGTERAIDDLDTQLRLAGCYPGPFIRASVKVTSRPSILEALRKYSSVAKGVMFVRGGGDSAGFKMWNEPEFIDLILQFELHVYLGLGHADNSTEFDRFADGVFATPTEAGTALAKALKASSRIQSQATFNSKMPSKMDIPKTYSEEQDPPIPLSVKIIIALAIFFIGLLVLLSS